MASGSPDAGPDAWPNLLLCKISDPDAATRPRSWSWWRAQPRRFRGRRSQG